MDGDDNGVGETEFRITTRSKTLSKTLDQDGAIGEKLLQLRNSRSGHPSTVTARKNEIDALLLNEENIHVKEKITGYLAAYEAFKDANFNYLRNLVDERSKVECHEYFDREFQRMKEFNDRVQDWIRRADEAARLHLQINPEDSVSQSGRSKASKGSRRSSRSSSSSISSARAKDAAGVAGLQAEAAAFKKRQLLEEQRFQLRQQQERLTLETEIAKAQAKENVLASLTESTPRSIVPNPVMLPVSRPMIGEFPDSKKLEIIPGVQTFPDSVKLEPKPGADQVPLAAAEPGAMRDRKIASLPGAKVTSMLNPEAPAWNQSLISRTIPDSNPVAPAWYEPHMSRTIPDSNPEAPAWNQPPIASSKKERTNESSHSNTSSTPSERAFHEMLELHQHQNTLQQQQNKIIEMLANQQRKSSLPQPRVPIFDGNPLEFGPFTRAFENIIESKTSNSSERLYYLEQFTSGDVKDVVRSCHYLPPERGYKEARRLMKKKFGDDYRIAAAYENKALNWPEVKNEDGVALNRFSIFLMRCKNAMEGSKYLSKLAQPETIQKLVLKLPFSLRTRWRRLVDHIMEVELRLVNFGDLANFVDNESRVATNPVFGRIVDDAKPRTTETSHLRKRPGERKLPELSLATQIRSVRQPSHRVLTHHLQKIIISALSANQVMPWITVTPLEADHIQREFSF